MLNLLHVGCFTSYPKPPVVLEGHVHGALVGQHVIASDMEEVPHTSMSCVTPSCSETWG